MKTISAVQLWGLIESLAKEMPEPMAVAKKIDNHALLAWGESVDPTPGLYEEAKKMAERIVNSLPADAQIVFPWNTILLDKQEAIAKVRGAEAPYSGTRINAWWWRCIYRAHRIAFDAHYYGHRRAVTKEERREIENTIALMVRNFATNLVEVAIRATA